MADVGIYAALDLSVPAFARRTRLYRLPPIGIGTPMVESLTSYMIRLAEAHVVSPGALILKELANFLPDRRSDSAERCGYTAFIYDAHTLNSATANTERWVSATEAATGRDDLRFLTMLPWKLAFSCQGLVRAKRAWCASCYQAWREAGDDIYEPLHWMIAAIPICFRHREPLMEICPHCGTEPHVIACKSLPGHCPRCGRWLGGVRQQTWVGPDGDMSGAQWIAESASALLVKSPAIGQSLSAPAVRTNLRNCIDDLCAGNKSLFRRTVQIDGKTIDQWVAGSILPSFASLLKVCQRLGIPLLRFITEVLGSSGDLDWHRARQAVSRNRVPGRRRCHILVGGTAIRDTPDGAEATRLSNTPRRLGIRDENPLRDQALEARRATSKRNRTARKTPRRRESNLRGTQMEQTLRAALLQDPPPSVRDVSVTLGLQHPATLWNRFPCLCHALAARSREHRKLQLLELEKALKTALTEEPPPTIKELAARIGYRTGQMLRQWFPDLYQALAARAAQRHDWWLNSRRALLEQALTEDPPPSGQSIAARVGADSSYLRALLPDLWRQVVARHAEYRNREAAKDRDAFREEVRRIARGLLKAGKYPSRGRVRSLIRNSKLDGAHLIVSEVRHVLTEFQASAP